MATVAEYMSSEIDPARADTTLVAAAQQMRHAGVGALPLVDDEGHCIGILTERDYVVRVVAEECDARAMIVRDVATPDPITCGPDEQAPAVVARMRENGVQHLPVLDDGRVTGILSLADVVFSRSDETRGVGIAPPG